MKHSSFSVLFCFAIAIFARSLYADELLTKGSWNIGVWSGGGSGFSETTEDTQLWLTGARFGKVLSSEKGKGPFRGQFEYAIEAIPAFVVFQNSTVYGFDITPVLLKWNFTGNRSGMPFIEIGAGALFTSDDVPERTSAINFTPQLGFGFHIPTYPRQAFTFTFKYIHISNGGLESPNPGINSFHILVGYQWSR